MRIQREANMTRGVGSISEGGEGLSYVVLAHGAWRWVLHWQPSRRRCLQREYVVATSNGTGDGIDISAASYV
jgi:hypothetical protein